MADPKLSRRTLFAGAGALVVAIGAPVGPEWLMRPAVAQGMPPPLAPDRLGSYVAIAADGSVTAFFGKIDGGQGVDVAVAQIVAEELDVAPERVTVLMGDTATSMNQGGASNASGVAQGALPLRNAAAELRLLLLEEAASRLALPVAALDAADGTVFVSARPEQRIAYGELVADRFRNVEMRWNGRIGNDLNVEGRARTKPVSAYKVVGSPAPRRDVATKAFAQHVYVGDVRVPGMLHARMIRPPVAGAVAEGIDLHSIAGIPNVRAVHRGAFVAVAAEREWDAVRAARALRVTWREVPPPFPDQDALYDHIRSAPARRRAVMVQSGDMEAALARAARQVSAEYEWPFQSHSSMGPGCAVADVRADHATVWTGTQKPHYARDGVAATLGLPPERVHAIWVTGPGSYGRNDAGDTALDAAILSREFGRPVRLQYMREDGHAWDTKSPASVHRLRAGLDAEGRLIGLSMESKGFSRLDVTTNEADPRDSLAAQMMGTAPNHVPMFLAPGQYTPLDPYDVPSKLMAWETIAPLLDRASPLRTGHLRDPLGPEIIFAGECFIDEVAAAASIDPLDFRLRHLRGERDIAVLRAAAERAGWTPRRAGPAGPLSGDTVTGRGISLARRDGTIVGLVVTLEVNRRSGQVRTRRMVAAHDCGLVVNPDGLRRCVEHGLVYASSRALHEEVTFSREMVTSADWATYPILDITEAPDEVEVILINRPELRPTGAGEAMVRAVAAAIGNAIFDATGIRTRRGPFTAERIRAALAAS